MIEFKDGEKKITVDSFTGIAPGYAGIEVDPGREDEMLYRMFFVDKELYSLLEQAMPHIKAIVEGE